MAFVNFSYINNNVQPKLRILIHKHIYISVRKKLFAALEGQA